MMDGEITENEERRLAELVEELDVSPTRAFELRGKVQTDLEGDG